MFKNKNNKLKQSITTHINNYQQQNLYTLYNSQYIKNILNKKTDTDKLTSFCEIITEWDDALPVPEYLGNKLEDLMNNENLYIGIHRTDLEDNIFDSDIAKNIFTEGLKNLGDLSSGAYQKVPRITKTVSLTNNMLQLFIMLKTPYKHSTGSFLLAFPKNIIEEDGDIPTNQVNNVYNYIHDVPHINPQYIIGYIDIKDNIMNFISKEKFLQQNQIKTQTNKSL